MILGRQQPDWGPRPLVSGRLTRNERIGVGELFAVANVVAVATNVSKDPAWPFPLFPFGNLD